MNLPKELTTVTPLSKAIAFLLFITLPVLAFMYGMNYQVQLTEQKNTTLIISPTQEPIVCTMDAKICPDGSAVGRVPPNCEFEECASDDAAGKKFTGIITRISYDCHMDGICGIGVGKGFVIVDSGESLTNNGQKGTAPDGLLDENKKNEFLGKNVEVFAKSSDGKTDSYTLFGSSEFYIKLVNDSTTQTFCGGIAGKMCPTGYYCKYDGTYPDAGGTCIKEKTTTKFICPKNDYVDCMPGPGSIKKQNVLQNSFSGHRQTVPISKVRRIKKGEHTFKFLESNV
ncbi:hypothetical protein COY13_02180 [Candidatus Roizmanbacteria bacterium CG_4_10_14_0_2_um_filter_36_35]|uniref:Uncharacterized protein n=4 Tax=Candidatus Roizmaniibacteriota TaxID=1752723 RepID=A0A2M7BWP5_9BACT|nr:MAG: hypothetical protein COV86_02395 [Candidatus Roizmanbacteria bacterium CG11_big_fil_rev_8_21_14_0_20_35_14]PIV10971.1 MAG: hypothetical protein COS50_02695 [Candidatus Roizmanbacteria bacterium CG03_land_8_20_14_0_80_35_26]PIZ67938.1 MAG: hypothetical protein COY13_02180 [Candidatus Roizmanbacteria bacterium CG_4_10_14_0_2_um_filter_36_35]PJC32607.1 MAG: hypothetical protein CO049_02435 [Candidatus Roizmanbacteria bacterium CG_4_9_14_0_2_um_filter_36_12]